MILNHIKTLRFMYASVANYKTLSQDESDYREDVRGN